MLASMRWCLKFRMLVCWWLVELAGAAVWQVAELSGSGWDCVFMCLAGHMFQSLSSRMVPWDVWVLVPPPEWLCSRGTGRPCFHCSISSSSSSSSSGTGSDYSNLSLICLKVFMPVCPSICLSSFSYSPALSQWHSTHTLDLVVNSVFQRIILLARLFDYGDMVNPIMLSTYLKNYNKPLEGCVLSFSTKHKATQ